MNTETVVANLDSPDGAIRAAIGQFDSRADFWRALNARLKQKGRDPLTRVAVTQWLRRKKGAPPDLCPDIEVISGVACENLRPEVSWAELRKTSKPPVFKPRTAQPAP